MFFRLLTRSYLCTGMAIVERHTSPDGLLTLIVSFADDDWTVGFEGCDWHTHGEILAGADSDFPDAQRDAVRAFVDDIVESRRVISIVRWNNGWSNVYISHAPHKDRARNTRSDVSIELRYWNGARIESA